MTTKTAKPKTTKKAAAKEQSSAPALTLNSLAPKHGARFERRRLGIGEGSGLGQTASRGMKGQRSRSGDGKMPGFEGGQTPLLRRVPKRGFTNGPFKKVYQVVSLESIERVFKNQKDVTVDALKLHGLISGRAPVKVLGDGELTRAYKISAHAFSASALEKIKKAGGAAEALEKKAETKA